MRILRPSSEAEMIAEFLRQEFTSAERYGARIRACLREEFTDPAIISDPNVADLQQNAARRRVLRRYRGYGSGQASFFTGFPISGVKWSWIGLTPDELLDTNYIRYEFWSRLSGGTRSPREAARRILQGDMPPGGADGTRAGFLALARHLCAGLQVPPLILVSADEGKTRVVLEGHTRLTAYALAPESMPQESEVLLGISPAIANWDEY